MSKKEQKERADKHFKQWREKRDLAIKVLEGELSNKTEAHIAKIEHLHEAIIEAMIQFADQSNSDTEVVGKAESDVLLAEIKSELEGYTQNIFNNVEEYKKYKLRNGFVGSQIGMQRAFSICEDILSK